MIRAEIPKGPSPSRLIHRAGAVIGIVSLALCCYVGAAHSDEYRPRSDVADSSAASSGYEAAPIPLAASYEVVKEWDEGFKAEITLRNAGSAPVLNWQLAFEYPTEIVNIWRAEIVSQSGDRYLVSGLKYSDSIAPGETIVFGFTGQGSPEREPVFLAGVVSEQAQPFVLDDAHSLPEPPRQEANASAPQEPLQQEDAPKASTHVLTSAKPLAATQTLSSLAAPDIDRSNGPIVDVAAGTSAADLQSVIDGAPAGSTIRLAEGEFEFDRTVTIERDDLTLEGAGSERTTVVYDPDSGEEGSAFALHSAGLSENYRLARDVSAGDRTIVLGSDQTFEAGEFVWLERPNTEQFFEEIGDDSWLRDQPLRTSIARVTAVNGNVLTLENGIYFDYDTADTVVRKLDMVENVTLRGFSIETTLGEADPADFSNNYEAYDFIAMVDLEGAYKPRLEDIAIYNSGSKAFLFKKTLALTAIDLLADGAHNKGAGGNGYAFELKDVYESSLSGLEDHGMRHSVIFASWYSAANNTVQVDFTDRDINFHGGRHHDNVVRVSVSERDPDADNLSSVVSYNTEGERWGAPTDRDVNSIVFDRVLGSKRPDDVTGDDDGAWLDGRGADDILHGGAGPDTLIGGKGDDELDGGNGTDRIFGGAGNDVIGYSVADADSVDGGTGVDRLLLDDLTVEFGLVEDDRITAVDILDLGIGDAARSVTLAAADVLDFEATTDLAETVSGGDNTINLVVSGDSADGVNLDAAGGAAWTLAGSQLLGGAYGGATYDLYTNGSEWIAIQQSIVVDTV